MTRNGGERVGMGDLPQHAQAREGLPSKLCHDANSFCVANSTLKTISNDGLILPFGKTSNGSSSSSSKWLHECSNSVSESCSELAHTTTHCIYRVSAEGDIADFGVSSNADQPQLSSALTTRQLWYCTRTEP